MNVNSPVLKFTASRPRLVPLGFNRAGAWTLFFDAGISKRPSPLLGQFGGSLSLAQRYALSLTPCSGQSHPGQFAVLSDGGDSKGNHLVQAH
jgi:hypothetical protein